MKLVRFAPIAFVLLAAACGNPNPGGDAGGGGDAARDGTIGDASGMDSTIGDANNDLGGGDTAASDTGSTDGSMTDGPLVNLDAVIVTEDGSTRTCVPISCSGHVLECGDCVDNDGDGVIDSRDPECLGPCDNTEGPELLTGVGGETGGPCASDCYFDFGNGPGNDDCHWDHRCDPYQMPPNYYPEGMACAYDSSRVGGRDCPADQSMQCHDFCRPLTPNGCDCFGCCTFPGLETAGPGGTPGYVWLGSRDAAGNGSCTLDQIANPTACHPCTPVGDCFNECGRCEVCIGRPVPPADCFMTPGDAGSPSDVIVPGDGTTPTDGSVPPDGGTSMQCPSGVQPCGLPGQADCPFNYYCVTGCCQMAPG